jgi:hypothetical protein
LHRLPQIKQVRCQLKVRKTGYCITHLEGEIITLIKENDDGWCTVRSKAGVVGVVPNQNLERMSLSMDLGQTISVASKRATGTLEKLKRRLSINLSSRQQAPIILSPTMLSPTIVSPTSFPQKNSFFLRSFSFDEPMYDDQRSLIIKEIRDTERTYLEGLQYLSNFYLSNLLKNNLLTTTREVEGLSSILGIILNFNVKLYEQLCESDMIGKKFLDMTPFLKTYTDYFQRFDAVTHVIKKEKSNVRFAEWLKMTEKKSKINGGMPLGDYLIIPIQRIPKYG